MTPLIVQPIPLSQTPIMTSDRCINVARPFRSSNPAGNADRGPMASGQSLPGGVAIRFRPTHPSTPAAAAYCPPDPATRLQPRRTPAAGAAAAKRPDLRLRRSRLPAPRTRWRHRPGVAHTRQAAPAAVAGVVGETGHGPPASPPPARAPASDARSIPAAAALAAGRRGTGPGPPDRPPPVRSKGLEQWIQTPQNAIDPPIHQAGSLPAGSPGR